MSRLRAFVLLSVMAFATASGASGPRTAGPLSKQQCARICAQLIKCVGLPPGESSTLAELEICVGDCVFESKDKQRRPGWRCASEADGCEALRKCNAGAKSEERPGPGKK